MFAARSFFDRTTTFAESQREKTTMAFTSFARGARAIGAASLLGAVGFPVAVLLIGTPIALLVRILQEALSWLTRSGGITGPFIEAFIALASSVGGVVLFALSARLLLTFFRQRRKNQYRRVSTDDRLL